MRGSAPRRLIAGLGLWITGLAGCAAFHPMDGVPARYLPAELTGGERTGRRTIDLSLLRQTPPAAHLIDSGDVLAVYVEGEVGRSTDPPPVFFPLNNEHPPSFGLPYPVREDGTISLPKIGSVNLRGLTIAQAEHRVRHAYLHPKQIIHPENHRVQVSLQRPRHYRVLVIRQDSQNQTLGDAGAGSLNIGLIKRGTGKVVSLPAYSNDVLNALTTTDGLPGLDAENAVYVIRRRGPRMGGTLGPNWPMDLDPTLLHRQGAGEGRPVVRGQSGGREPRYLHSPSIGPSTAGDYSTGSLHEPMRLAAGDRSVTNAYHQGSLGATVTQAHWTGHQPSDFDPSRPQPLPPEALSVGHQQGIVQVSAWNGAEPSHRYGNPNAQNANPSAVPLPYGWQPQESIPSAAWNDLDAQARAMQLVESGAWLPQPSATGIQTAFNQEPSPMAPGQSMPGLSNQPSPLAAPPMQVVPQRQFISQQPAPGPMGWPATPVEPVNPPQYGSIPLGTPPVPQSPGPAMNLAPEVNPNWGAASTPMTPAWNMPQPMPDHTLDQQPVGGYPVLDNGHGSLDGSGLDGRHVIRIPIRLGPGETADIREEDVILQDGDIVFIESRETEVFYTAGLLGGGQFTLPRDYDLDILQALSLATSRNTNGGGARTLGGVSALNNDVSVSPSTVIVLRKLPDGGEVPIKVDLYRARTDRSERIIIQPGDYILLQYTPLEAVVAFLERHLLEGALFGLAAQNLNTNNGGN